MDPARLRKSSARPVEVGRQLGSQRSCSFVGLARDPRTYRCLSRHAVERYPSTAAARPGNEALERLCLRFRHDGLIALTTALSAWIIGKIVDKIFVGQQPQRGLGDHGGDRRDLRGQGLRDLRPAGVLSRIANSIVADVQTRIFDQMLRMKVSYYGHSHSSEFMARQAFIAQSASGALNLLITTLSRDALTIVGLVVVMVSQDPLLSLLALMFVPLAAFGVRKIGLRVRGIMASEFQGAMQMMESLQETAQGIRIVKAFTLEGFMRARQAARSKLRERGQQARRGQFAHQPDHGEPRRLRHRRSGALQRLHRHHPRQSARKPVLLHHLGHHAL